MTRAGLMRSFRQRGEGMAVSVVPHRRGGWVVTEGGDPVSRHCTEWSAAWAAEGYRRRRRGPRLGPAPVMKLPARAPREQAQEGNDRLDRPAVLLGAAVLSLLLWGAIAAAVIQLLRLAL